MISNEKLIEICGRNVIEGYYASWRTDSDEVICCGHVKFIVDDINSKYCEGLDRLIQEFIPNITVMQMFQIMQFVEVGTHSESDYYQSKEVAHWNVDLAGMFNYLGL